MKRVLIAYASKAGSTAEVADRMGKILSDHGLTVDVKPISSVRDLNAYQAVILGSAIRVGSVLPEAMKFIQDNQTTLAEVPFSLFIVCMTLEKDTEENRKTVSDYLNPVREVIRPDNEGLFAGVMDLKKLPLIERLMIKAMKAPLGDFRRWDEIDTWTEKLALAA